MNILSIHHIKKSYGVKTLFENVSFTIEDDDKTGVIGVNGTGKSSMLRIIAGQDTPDEGEVETFGAVRVEYLAQTPELDPAITVIDQVFRSNTLETNLVRDYERATTDLARHPEDPALQKRLLTLSDTLDAKGLWNLQSQIETVLTKLGITDFDKPVGELSGGQRKRIALAAVLLAPCDLLILDEPTNHLDNETITWLETFLKNRKGALLMVTHDRYFLDRVVTKTLELDKGHLYEYTGNYSEFVTKKAERRAFENIMEQKRQNLYRRELAWMRRGARARTTKQKARIQRFEILQAGGVDTSEEVLDLDVAFTRLGRQVVDLSHVTKAFDGQTVISDFSAVLGPSERIGIVGPNGRGKSTLLNLIAGRLTPDSGTVALGDTVKLGYFSQESEDMDVDLRAIEYIRDTAEMVETASGATLTAAQMMERFLFDRNAQWVRITEMSGGERRRLYLLRVLMEAPNVLLLDEPTNDLDIDTLDLLEDLLESYDGTVFLVSHDRTFLDNVVTSTIAFEGDGNWREYEGGVQDWLVQSKRSRTLAASAPPVRESAANNSKKNSPEPLSDKPEQLLKKKLSYKEQRELDQLPQRIADLESEQKALQAELADGRLYSQDAAKAAELHAREGEIEEQLMAALERWSALSS